MEISEEHDSGCDGIIDSYTNRTYDSNSNEISYFDTDGYFSFEDYNSDGQLVSRNNSLSSSSGGGYEINHFTYDNHGRINGIDVYQNLSLSTSEDLIQSESINLFGDEIWGHGEKIQFQLERVPFFPPTRYYIDATLIGFIDWKFPQSEFAGGVMEIAI